MDSGWIEYQCETGETLFMYNKVTGEHKWPNDSNITCKEFCSTGTQTDDYGCNNGCTSMYIDADSCHASNNPEISPQQQPGLLDEDYFGDKSGPLNSLEYEDEPQDDNQTMEEIASILRAPEEIQYSEESTVVANSTGHGNSSAGNINANKSRKRIADTSGKEKSFHCSECDTTFIHKWSFVRHLKRHTGERPFECTHCLKKFAEKTTLVDHLKTHTLEKPYECSYCDKRYSRKNRLKEHTRSHTLEKPFGCPRCEKRFTLKKYLKDHLRSHSGEKTFQCSQCKKAFTLKQTLDRHEKEHAGEKPFACPHCEKTFARKFTLNVHLKKHSGDQPPFECPDCGKKYSQKKSFNGHLKTHTAV